MKKFKNFRFEYRDLNQNDYGMCFPFEIYIRKNIKQIKIPFIIC